MKAGSCRSHTKVGKFYQAFFGGQNIGSFDVAMDHSLFVQILKSMENLRHIMSDKPFWKLAKVFAYRMKRAVLAVSVIRQQVHTLFSGVLTPV